MIALWQYSRMSWREQNKELKDLNIKQEFSIDHKSPNNWTCLHAACQYGNLALVEYLLEELKCSPNILSGDGWGALHIASHLGFYEIVNIILQNKKTNHNLIGNLERGTGLHWAVNAGHFNVVQIYLMNNVDFDVKDADNKSPKDIWKDPNILLLFERVEKWKKEGNNKTTILDSPREEIKEDPAEYDEDFTGDKKFEETTEVTIKFDIDNEESKQKQQNQNSKDFDKSFEDSRESLILESEYNKELVLTEEYLDKVIEHLEEFKNNKKFCGYLTRVGRYYMSSKNRYFELNPIQGTFIKFKNEGDYPHKPRQIINLMDVIDISIINDGWFQK